MARRRTNEEAKQILLSRNILMLGTYIDANVSVDVQCMVCGHKWKAIITTQNAQRGCPNYKCRFKSVSLSEEEIDNRLKLRNITRLEPYQTLEVSIKFKCNTCDYIWITKPYNIIKQKTGCPLCGRIKSDLSRKLSNDIIDQRLINTNIERIDDFILSTTSIRFKCKKCNHIWMAVPDHVANLRDDKTECPLCTLPGYNANLLITALQECEVPFDIEYNIKKININASNNFRLDIFYTEIKVAIEYNGKQHYIPSTWGNMSNEEAIERFDKQKIRDTYIEQFCKDNDIHLIWIDGREHSGVKLTSLVNGAIIPLIRSKASKTA